MPAKRLNIPGDTNINLTKGVDTLEIVVTKNCSWCYSDPSTVFSNGLLAAGTYTATDPHTCYGPYVPSSTGTVNFDAPTSGTCNPNGGPTETIHTIVVS
jgi:hypothetical protein